MTESEIAFANRVTELVEAYNDGTLEEEAVKALTPLSNDDYSKLICDIVRALSGRLREQSSRFEWDEATIERWCDALRNRVCMLRSFLRGNSRKLQVIQLYGIRTA